jgi:hypothetical protein
MVVSEVFRAPVPDAAPVMRDPVTRRVECPAMLARGWRRGAAAPALLRL